MNVDFVLQFFIFFFGGMAVYLVSSLNPQTRMTAGVLGICGQPFWVASTILNGQWGIFILSFVYLYSWIKVVYNNRKYKEKCYEC